MGLILRLFSSSDKGRLGLFHEHVFRFCRAPAGTRILDSQLSGHSGNVTISSNMPLSLTDPFTFMTPLRSHLLKRIPKTVPRTKRAIKHQRDTLPVRYLLHGQNGGSHRQTLECAPSANHIQPISNTQPSPAMIVARFSNV